MNPNDKKKLKKEWLESIHTDWIRSLRMPIGELQIYAIYYFFANKFDILLAEKVQAIREEIEVRGTSLMDERDNALANDNVLIAYHYDSCMVDSRNILSLPSLKLPTITSK